MLFILQVVLKHWVVNIQNEQLITSFATEPEPRYLFTAGYNNYGPLGHNNRTPLSSPTQLPGSNWVKSSRNFGDSQATLFTKQMEHYGHGEIMTKGN